MTLYIGTAGWSYPKGKGKWDGVFYPDKLADAEKLPFYAQYFNTVEINSSFYRPPAAAAAEAWASRVPPQFRFTAKLWQKFTHPKLFEETTGKTATLQDKDFDEFIAGIEPLASAGKLGPLLAQFPVSFKADEGSLDYLADLVRRFQGAGFSLAVELRHREWTASRDIGPRVRALLEEENVAWVMIDEPKFRTRIKEVPLTTAVGYFRFHGRNYQSWWSHKESEDRYNYLYPESEQRDIAAEVLEVTGRVVETYAFYNNHFGAKAVVNALELQRVAGTLTSTPLPEPLIAAYPDLTR